MSKKSGLFSFKNLSISEEPINNSGNSNTNSNNSNSNNSNNSSNKISINDFPIDNDFAENYDEDNLNKNEKKVLNELENPANLSKLRSDMNNMNNMSNTNNTRLYKNTIDYIRTICFKDDDEKTEGDKYLIYKTQEIVNPQNSVSVNEQSLDIFGNDIHGNDIHGNDYVSSDLPSQNRRFMNLSTFEQNEEMLNYSNTYFENLANRYWTPEKFNNRNTMNNRLNYDLQFLYNKLTKENQQKFKRTYKDKCKYETDIGGEYTTKKKVICDLNEAELRDRIKYVQMLNEVKDESSIVDTSSVVDNDEPVFLGQTIEDKYLIYPNTIRKALNFFDLNLPITKTAVQKKYVKLARQFHPDKNPGIDENKFKNLTNANGILNSVVNGSLSTLNLDDTIKGGSKKIKRMSKKRKGMSKKRKGMSKKRKGMSKKRKGMSNKK
jgi:hypothetical protein